MLMVNFVGINASAEDTVVVTYEDFGYQQNVPLKDVSAAGSGDDEKGFSNGWKNKVPMSDEVAGNVIVGGDGSVHIVEENDQSVTICRGLNNPIDMKEDRIYYITCKIKINDGADVDNTSRTVKILLAPTGGTSGTSQIQCGMQGGHNGHFSPYMRVTDTLESKGSIEIEKNKEYQLFIKIDSSSSGDDVISYFIYPVGEEKQSAAVTNKKRLNSVFSVVGYQEWLGGGEANSFGDLRIEQYGESLKNKIKQINDKLSEAQEGASSDIADEAEAMIESFPGGFARTELEDKLEEVKKHIEESGNGGGGDAGGSESNTDYIGAFVYEDFKYTNGAKLNTIERAKNADAEKGFQSGWQGNINLDAALSDLFEIEGNGLLKSRAPTSGSIAMYRKLAQPVNLSSNTSYFISWSMKINDSAAIDANYRQQKLILAPSGAGAQAEQVMFGFSGGRGSDLHYSPYVRVLSTVKYCDDIVLERGKLYTLYAVINAGASEADTVKFAVCKENELPDGSWDIEVSGDLSPTLNIIGFQEYLGGTGNNNFGRLSGYSFAGEEKTKFNSLEKCISDAATTLDMTYIDRAADDVEGIGYSVVKEYYNNCIESIKARAIAENAVAQQVADEITQIENEDINVNNHAEIDERISELKETVSQFTGSSNRNKYTQLIEELEKSVWAKKILALKVKEPFQYTSGTTVNSVTADSNNGWLGGYYIDEALTEMPGDEVVFSDGYYGLGTKLYRKMAYPTTVDGDNISYIKWEFEVDAGGCVEIGIGDNVFGVASAPYINQVLAKNSVEKGKKYTAVLRLSADKASLKVFDEFYNGVYDVEGDVLSEGESIISISGRNAKLYSFEKENLNAGFTSAAEAAIQKAVSSKLIADIDHAKECANAMEQCILKSMILDSYEGLIDCNKKITPVIKSAGIKGVVSAGEKLVANYSIYDEGKNFSKVEITWYCGGNTATGTAYEVPANAGGEKVYYKIKAYNIHGNASPEYTSTQVTVPTAASKGSLGGFSSKGGSGGTSVPQKIPVYFEDKPTDVPAKKADGFTDISRHWAEQTILNMFELGIIKGVSDTEFKPDDIITRAEFAAIIVNAFDIKGAEEDVEFADVQKDDWFYESIMNAAAAGIVSGYDGRFNPEAGITREEMAKICCDAYLYSGLDDIPAASELIFTDDDKISDWAKDFVNKAASAGLIVGMDDGSFAPSDSATRAEGVTVIKRLMDKINF